MTYSGTKATSDFAQFSLRYATQAVKKITYLYKKRLKLYLHLQQEIDVSTWLSYPRGKSIFPLFAHNYGQVALNETSKMHVLIEANLDTFNPVGSVKSNKVQITPLERKLFFVDSAT